MLAFSPKKVELNLKNQWLRSGQLQENVSDNWIDKGCRARI